MLFSRERPEVDERAPSKMRALNIHEQYRKGISMEIHEYQAKELLKNYGIPSPPFFVASSVAKVEKIIRDNHLSDLFLKVQIHAGGRGKSGGIVHAKSQEEILACAKDLLGKKIVNDQTGPLGLTCHEILLTAPLKIHAEYYSAACVDRNKSSCFLLISKSGGMEVEQQEGEMISEEIFCNVPIKSERLEEMANKLGWQGKVKEEGIAIIKAIRDAFFAYDATLVEINPLALVNDGHLVAVDAKMTIDEDALFRHKELLALRDPSQLSLLEWRAKENGLAYVLLDGDIGCMVNGAGLAMATMDLIAELGGKAANFLDVGGLSTPEKILVGFDILLEDRNAKVIFINIFGGIVTCVSIAEVLKGVIEKNRRDIPFVIRLAGNQHEEGIKILQQAKLNIHLAETLEEGAKKAIECARGS
jgi:succinyl-CoA synthetase beta subunit